MTNKETLVVFAAAAFQAMLTEQLREAESRKLAVRGYEHIAKEAWKAGEIMREHTPKD